MALTLPLSLAGEHRFWLDILKEHAHFLLDRLSPDEETWILEVRRYAEGLAALQSKLTALASIPEAPSHAEWIAFAKEANPYAAGYYKLEGRIQAQLLSGQIRLKLPPAFLNGTMNENQEYLRLLRYYVQGADAPALPLWNLMELWLDDQLGHAELLLELSEKDYPEPELIRQAESAARAFKDHLIRNKAIHGYLRFTAPGFPEQLAAARQAAESVCLFNDAVTETVRQAKLGLQHKSFAFRFLEHQIPETDYFLGKLKAWIPA